MKQEEKMKGASLSWTTEAETDENTVTDDDNSQTLLRRQHQAMHDYREALRQRIRIDADAANLKVEIHDPDDE